MYTKFGQPGNDGNIDTYMIEKIKNPDTGSDFEKQTQILRDSVPQEQRLPALQTQGYQTYIMADDQQEPETVAGFIAYQVHNNIAHVFRFEVESDYRGKGYAKDLFQALLIEPELQKQGITAIKIGKGPSETATVNEESAKIIQKLSRLNKYTIDPATHTIQL